MNWKLRGLVPLRVAPYLHKDSLGGKGAAVLHDEGVGGGVHLLVWEMVDWPHLTTQVYRTNG